MSENVTYVGQIAMLQTKLTAIQQEDADNRFRNEGSPLRINYNGTLIYTFTQIEENAGILFTDNISEHSLPSLAHAAGFHIFSASITGYSCNWYNGSDCHLDLLTVEEFRDRSRFMRIRTKNCVQKEPISCPQPTQDQEVIPLSPQSKPTLNSELTKSLKKRATKHPKP